MDLSYFDTAPPTFTANFEKTRDFIQTCVLSTWREFYIGITKRLAYDHKGRNRWNEPGFGHVWHGWQKMILLYASPNAHRAIHDGTGKMEDDLIVLFGKLPGCQNKKRGGGGASRASRKEPSFTYLIVR